MFIKKLLLIFALTALCGLISADNFLKNLNKRHASSIQEYSKTKSFSNLIRRKRDIEKTVSSEADTTDSFELAKFFIGLAWQENKLDLLTQFIEEISDVDNNITIIGWQRIQNDDGGLKEINTIEFVIPPKPQTEIPLSNVVKINYEVDETDDWENRVLPNKEINLVREILLPYNLLGIPVSVTAEEYDEDGNQEYVLYIDRDQLYGKADNFSIYNKTSTATYEEISQFIASLKPAALGKPSVLKYDENDHLLVDQSNIRPQILGAVTDYYEIPDNILAESPAIIARISQKYSHSEIPRQLASQYNKSYPEYKWRVLTDPENTYITRDVSITLSYDNFDLDESSEISWLVYGVKK